MDAAHANRRHVGEILVAEGIISAEDLARALAEQAQAPRPIGKVLVDLGIASPGAIANALAEQHGGVLKTEYGVSAGIHRARQPQPEPEPAEPEPEPEPVAEQPAEDPLAPWRAAVAERDAMIRRLADAVRERDARLAAAGAQESAPPAVDETRIAELEEAVATANGELVAARAQLEERADELARTSSSLRDREAELASVRDRLAAAEEQVATLRAGAAAAETSAFELKRLAATVRSREAEVAVVRLLDERRRSAAAAEAEPEPEREHLLFVPRGGAYALVRREGPPPARGESVDGFVVLRVGASPLPDGPRACAYLAAR